MNQGKSREEPVGSVPPWFLPPDCVLASFKDREGDLGSKAFLPLRKFSSACVITVTGRNQGL